MTLFFSWVCAVLIGADIILKDTFSGVIQAGEQRDINWNLSKTLPSNTKAKRQHRNANGHVLNMRSP